MNEPKRKSAPGDPRLRVLLFLLLGSALIYASFNDGPRHDVKERRVGRLAVADEAAASGASPLLAGEMQRSRLQAGMVMITASSAVRVSDLSAAGRFSCAVGLSISNGLDRDIDALDFGIAYQGQGGGGGVSQHLSLAAQDSQAVTPATAAAGDCEGLTGRVSIYRCTLAGGGDCSRAVRVPGPGPIPLSLAS